MTPLEALEKLYKLDPNGQAADACITLLALLRRDWDVRVLDAWARAGSSDVFGQRRHHVAGTLCVLAVFARIPRTRRGEWSTLLQREGANEDAARHAAALAVLPTLPEAKRAELGECP